LHSLKYSPSVLDSQSWCIHRLLLFAYFKEKLLSAKIRPIHHPARTSCTVHVTCNEGTENKKPLCS
jgi:hypothetical protein